MELAPPMSPALIALMLVSLFGITKTYLEARVEVSDQPIEVGADAKPKAKSSSHLIKEGEVGPDEEAS